MLPGAARRGGISLRGPSMEMVIGTVSGSSFLYGYRDATSIGGSGFVGCGSLSNREFSPGVTVYGLFEAFQDIYANRYIVIGAASQAIIDSTMSRIKRMRIPNGTIITSPHLVAIDTQTQSGSGIEFKGWRIAEGVLTEYNPRLDGGTYQLLG